MTDPTTPTPRPFRFGVVAPVPGDDVPAWRDGLRRIEDSGYDTVLMPDVPGMQPAPVPALAVAATLTGLRIGTWVYASPLRLAWQTAWEAHSLGVLSQGRFELGLGTGRPGLDAALRELGAPAMAPGESLARVRDTVAALRRLEGNGPRVPVVMALRGPKAMALAAEVADTVTFASMPNEPRAALTAMVHDFRARTTRDVELAMHVPVVGDARAAYMTPPDTDVEALRAADSYAVLPTDPAAAVDEIHRRRAEAGFTYYVVGSGSAASFAPVVARLSGAS